jgi:hypothetical protein
MHAKCPAHLIILDLVALVISMKYANYKASYCVHVSTLLFALS